MKDGVIYYPNEIYEAYGIVPFASPPPVTPAAPQPATLPVSAPNNAFSEDGDGD